MAFRSHRLPFQFSSSDPAQRQAELQKRFGLPTANSPRDKMLLDFSNPDKMGTWSGRQGKNSPLLQRREPAKDKEWHNDVQDVNTSRKPTVRVVPIEIEGADTGVKRARNYSEPDSAMKKVVNDSDLHPNLSSSYVDIPVKVESLPKKQPKVCNIPIKVEERNKSPNKAKKSTPRKEESPKPKKQETTKKQANDTIVNGHVEAAEKCDPSVLSLKQISAVLENLTKYQEEVEQFSGTTKDKQYKYLDEMLVRCMLDLDNVETMGKDDIRQARKAAVKKVQSCIDLLESKTVSKEEPVNNANPVEADSSLIPNGDITSVSHVESESSSQTQIAGEEKVEEVEVTPVTEENLAAEVIHQMSSALPPSEQEVESESFSDLQVADEEKIEEVEMTPVPEDNSADEVAQRTSSTLPPSDQKVDMASVTNEVSSVSTLEDAEVVKDIEMTTVAKEESELGLNELSSTNSNSLENNDKIELIPVTEETSANQETKANVAAAEEKDVTIKPMSDSCELTVEPNSSNSSVILPTMCDLGQNETTQEVEMTCVSESSTVDLLVDPVSNPSNSKEQPGPLQEVEMLSDIDLPN